MTESVTMQKAVLVRCSDADRERIAERLRVAAGEGRLTMDELEERLTGVYAARYGHELDALVVDLPLTRASSPAGWRTVLAVASAQLGADLAVSARRRWAVAILAMILLAGFALLAAHGFGDHGFDHHGFNGPDGGSGFH